jgi:hypothetical protein
MGAHRLAIAVAAFTLWVSLAPASSAQDGPPVSADEAIVVEGRRTEDVIRAFVSDMALPSPRQGQLARWDRRICPGVAGLRPRYAQFVIDRMAQRALDVGLDIGDPGCRANILIVVSTDPGAVARELFENHRRLMGYYDERGRSSQGRRALQAFVDSTAPVRWWHVNNTVTRDGEVIRENARDNDFAVTRLTGPATRLQGARRQDFAAAFVVVDARVLPEIDFDFGALADYLAMVALAQLDPGADTSAYPTILNLFSPEGATAPENRPRTATAWDTAYLRGQYEATREARSAGEQESDIARSIARELAPGEAQQR